MINVNKYYLYYLLFNFFFFFMLKWTKFLKMIDNGEKTNNQWTKIYLLGKNNIKLYIQSWLK